MFEFPEAVPVLFVLVAVEDVSDSGVAMISATALDTSKLPEYMKVENSTLFVPHTDGDGGLSHIVVIVFPSTMRPDVAQSAAFDLIKSANQYGFDEEPPFNPSLN